MPDQQHVAHRSHHTRTHTQNDIMNIMNTHSKSKHCEKKMKREQIIIVNLCGRGDKDIDTVSAYLGVEA